MPRGAQGDGTVLVIVGDTLHHRDDQGRLHTHGALAGQLDLWAARFDRVRFLGVLGDGPPPPGFAPYEATNIALVPLRAAGGSGTRAKIGALVTSLSWLVTLVPELRRADAAHLRAPCNVTMPGLMAARLLVKHRYAIYAGSWESYPGEPRSYRAQRWWLRRAFGGTVHAYLPDEASDPPRRPAFSPVLNRSGLDVLVETAATRRLTDGPPGVERPLRVVSVGRFSANKNQIALVRALHLLAGRGVTVEACLIGEGPEAARVAAAAAGLDHLRFVDHADRDEVFDAMGRADLVVLPSFREGYPKVLLEGISAGALPVAADRPVNRAMVQGRGWVFDPDDPDELAAVLEQAIGLSVDGWAERRACALDYARSHTLEAFAAEIDAIVGTWDLPAPALAVGTEASTER